MKPHAWMLLTVALVLVLTACAGGMKKSPIPDVEGNTAYTQRNLWVVQGRHEASNYRMGEMIPVNAQACIDGTTGRTITATLTRGRCGFHPGAQGGVRDPAQARAPESKVGRASETV